MQSGRAPDESALIPDASPSSSATRTTSGAGTEKLKSLADYLEPIALLPGLLVLPGIHAAADLQ